MPVYQARSRCCAFNQSSMADVCSVRCLAERRSYCKDLHKWGKNLLYMVGLESIVKEFLPTRSKLQWTQFSPFLHDDHKSPPADWDPGQPCVFCERRKRKAQEIAQQKDNKKTTQKPELPSRKAAASSERSTPQVPTKQVEQPSAAFPELKTMNFETSNAFANAAMLMPGLSAANIASSFMTGPTVADMAHFQAVSLYLSQMLAWAQQPLMSFHNPLATTSAVASLPVQQAAPAKQANAIQPSKHAKKQQAQQKATTAATKSPVVYQPIAPKPSATINQKGSSKCDDQPLDLSVSKSGVESKCDRSSVQSAVGKSTSNNSRPDSSSLQIPTPSNNGANKKSYSQHDLEAAVQDIINGRLGTRRASVVYGIPRSTLRNKVYKLEATDDTIASKRLRRALDRPSSPPQNASVRTHSAESEVSPQEAANKLEPFTVALNLWPDKITLGSSPMWLQHQLVTKARHTALADAVNDIAAGQTPLRESLLNSSCTTQASPKVQSLLKHTVAHILGEQIAKRDDDAGDGSDQLSESSQDDSPNLYIDTESPEPSPENSTESMDAGQSGARKNRDHKRIRPKRGQYRKYDKAALAEAVRSVRSGEMSVHRAGSYYGVPHSTLEYKVKERNLLRPRKRDLKKQGHQSKNRNEDSSSSSGKESPCVREVVESLRSSSKKTPLSATEQNSGEWPYLQSTGNNAQYFASDMMRKLQQEATKKQT